jgi:hypothetical protein
LDCPRDRNLRCPTQILQDAGNVIPVVANPKFPLDDLGNTGTGPDVATKTIGFGSMPEEIRNLVSLRNSQLWRGPAEAWDRSASVPPSLAA